MGNTLSFTYLAFTESIDNHHIPNIPKLKRSSTHPAPSKAPTLTPQTLILVLPTLTHCCPRFPALDAC
jgi:hypothetical protein